MLKPSWSLTLDTFTLSSETLGPLIALDVRRSKDGSADEAIIVLGRVPSVNPAEGGDAVIALGWDGDTEPVFTGIIEEVERGIGRLEVHCLGTLVKMMQKRGNTTFVNQAAGEIVKTLADEAGVATDEVQNGVGLPVYLADSSRRHYDHCRELARRCGFDLYTTEEGKLVFAAFAVASADHTFRYGEHILGASVDTGTPLDGVTVVPESPASSAGDETAAWFVKDPSPHTGTAGGGAATLLRSDPLLRTKQAADTAAKANLYFSRRDAVVGHVELMGNPVVTLGETVALDGVPGEGVDGIYQVMAVRHRLDQKRGFRTYVSLGGMP